MCLKSSNDLLQCDLRRWTVNDLLCTFSHVISIALEQNQVPGISDSTALSHHSCLDPDTSYHTSRTLIDCLNFLIHIDLDMDAIPFPLEDRPVLS